MQHTRLRCCRPELQIEVPQVQLQQLWEWQQVYTSLLSVQDGQAWAQLLQYQLHIVNVKF